MGSMRPEDEERSHHLLDAAREAINFAEGLTRADLDTDRGLTLVLTKEVEIIGKAAFKVSASAQDGLSQIPWVEIIGMRHL